MRRLIPVLTCFMLITCAGNNLQQGSVKKKFNQDTGTSEEKNSGSDLNKDAQDPSIVNGNYTTTPWAPLPDSAVIPVAVSGASLLCHKEDAIHCLATDDQGKEFGFEVTQAYYAVSTAQEWLPTTFHGDLDDSDVPNSRSSRWTIDIPLDMQDQEIAILLLNDKDSLFMADWITHSNQSALNLVQDGSFENQRIDINNLENTRFLSPKNQKAWIARLPVLVNPCYPILELSSAEIFPTAKASDASQWVELTANCQAGLGSERNLIALSQSLNLQVNHSYLLSFDYMSPLGKEAPTLLKVSLNDEILFKQDVAVASWTSFKTIFTAKTIVNTIDFEEMGLVKNRGTALDNISIIDLGDFGK